MKSLLRRLALIATLLSELQTRFAVRGDEIDIILRSNGSMHSDRSVKGLSVDLINGSTVSLEAVYRKDDSALTQLELSWHKDGTLVPAPYVMRRRVCGGNMPPVRCSLNLSISMVYGNKSGNYSLAVHVKNNVSVVASVNIVFGDAKAVSFTNSPTGVVNCSSANSSVVLSYSAVGFPAPMYNLTCRGWDYSSERSITGKFIIPPEVCCAGAVCRATAFNEYERTRSEEVTVRAQPIEPICQQHVGCRSPRLDVLVKSCMSAASGNIVTGRAVSIAGDDSAATLEAVAYRNISSRFVQFRLAWFKDGAFLSGHIRWCEGYSRSGLWMLCRLRLPISELTGNRSGNYTVEWEMANVLVASAWVVVTVSDRGSESCSSNSDSHASPSVSPRFPPTYGLYCGSQMRAIVVGNNGSVTTDTIQFAPMAVTSEATISNNVSLIVSTVTLGTMVVAAILAYVVCKRAGSFHMKITRKYFTVPGETRCYNENVACDSDPLASAALIHSDLDRACIEHSRDIDSPGGLLLHQTTPPPRWIGTLSNAEDVEIDAVITSVVAESASHNGDQSLPIEFARKLYVDQQPPVSAERSNVHNALTNAVETENKSSVTLIIHAENVQVGTNNKMFIENCTCSTADSAYGSTKDADSCTSSPAFDECGSARESGNLLRTKNDFSFQEEQPLWSGAASLSLDLHT